MLQLFTIEVETFDVLKKKFEIPSIKENFALAGGTALALQIGHRQSMDLDIFCPNKFDVREIEIILSSEPDIKFDFVNSNNRMLFGYANNIKCDFVHEPAKLIQPLVIADGINLFHVQDIAAMKMHTICGMGKKKDFFDVYALIETFGWKNMVEWFGLKYGESQFYFLWKSIIYFDDANDDPDIISFSPFTKTWGEIKKFIKKNCV